MGRHRPARRPKVGRLHEKAQHRELTKVEIVLLVTAPYSSHFSHSINATVQVNAHYTAIRFGWMRVQRNRLQNNSISLMTYWRVSLLPSRWQRFHSIPRFSRRRRRFCTTTSLSNSDISDALFECVCEIEVLQRGHALRTKYSSSHVLG